MGKKYKMSSAQKRLFALYEIDKNSIAYNIPSLYKTPVYNFINGRLADKPTVLKPLS